MLDEEIANKIGLSKYLKDGTIDVPPHCKKICVDVGLSTSAPNSAIWLVNCPDRCVIGIEPLEYNWERLRGKHDEGTDFCDGWAVIRVEPDGLFVNNTKLPGPPPEFYGLQCAIDNIMSPEEKAFYHMEEEGSSSLLEPSETHPHKIKKLEKVQCVNLKDILDHVDWERFQVIEHLKADCEGHDFEVIKSAGEYLDRIVFVTYEMSSSNSGHWHEHYNFDDSVQYMIDKGFTMVRYDGGNVCFMNNKFANSVVVNGWVRHITNYYGIRDFVPIVVSNEMNAIFTCDVLRESF